MLSSIHYKVQTTSRAAVSPFTRWFSAAFQEPQNEHAGAVPGKRSNAFLFLVTSLLVFCIAPQTVRLLSLLRYSDMQVDTGIEGPNFYNIWRVMNHHPLYADPWTPPFSVTLYNFGFYYFFGAVGRLLGIHDAGIMLFARMLSLAFALFGSYVMARFVMLLCGISKGPAAWAAVMFALIAWLGSNSTVWWSMSGRPDMPGCAFALLGCYLYARRLNGSSWTAFLPAGASFAAAWLFKQSSIWTAVACGLYAVLVRRKWKEVLGLVLPGLCLLVLVKIVAPPVYWQNVVAAPTLDAFSIETVLHNTLEVVLPNLVYFAVPLLILFHGKLRRALCASDDPQGSAMRLMLFVCVVDIGLGIVAVGREGAGRNQFFEAMFSCAVLASAVIVSAFLRPGLHVESPRLIRVAIVIALLALIPLPLATLLRPTVDSGALHWHLTWMNPSSYLQRKILVSDLKKYPLPLLTRDEVLSLPWNSSADAYPAPTTDGYWYELALRRGKLSGSWATEIAAHHFGTLVLSPDDSLVPAALAAGYQIKARYDSTVGEFGNHEKLLILSIESGNTK